MEGGQARLPCTTARAARLRTRLRRDDTATDVVRLSRETGHSRFPVIGDDSDDIVGLVHLRRAIAVPYERRGEVPAAALMVDAPRVPETVHLGPLLVELREHGIQMAVVVDEYGGTSGVVTLEDVVEATRYVETGQKTGNVVLTVVSNGGAGT